MASLSKEATLSEFAGFVDFVYGVPNDRHYTLWDMLTNIQRFSMRGIKGVRKKDKEKVKLNLLISASWYASLLSRFHIDIEETVWSRFPYLCSYCGRQPCICKTRKIASRRKVIGDESLRPRTMKEFQTMFDRIYPAKHRSREDAAIHLAEEVGELSEAFQTYMGKRSSAGLKKIKLEAADVFSCVIGVFNSFGIDFAEEAAKRFSNNCHVCHNAPCTCTFEFVSKFKS